MGPNYSMCDQFPLLCRLGQAGVYPNFRGAVRATNHSRRKTGKSGDEQHHLGNTTEDTRGEREAPELKEI